MKNKNFKKITKSLRIGGLKPQHHEPFHLIATPPPPYVDKVNCLLPPKKKDQK